MKLGVTAFLTEQSINPANLARAIEERGLDSLWLPEHTHVPLLRETAYPPGGEIPDEYARTYDPFVALSFAAAATTRLRLGTGVCNLAQRDPIVTAKLVASLDVLSDGRFLFGVGAGWSHEELRNHGTDPGTRFALLRERILAMRVIWTQDESEFHGRFVDFDPIRCWPKPVSVPCVPVLVGGTAPAAFKRVLDYGDGWMPMGHRATDDVLKADIADLRRQAADRDLPRPMVVLYSGSSQPHNLDMYRAAGIDEVIFWLPTAPAATVLPILDRYGALVAKFGSGTGDQLH